MSETSEKVASDVQDEHEEDGDEEESAEEEEEDEDEECEDLLEEEEEYQPPEDVESEYVLYIILSCFYRTFLFLDGMFHTASFNFYTLSPYPL